MITQQPYTGELHPDCNPAAIGMPLAQAVLDLGAPDRIARRDAAIARVPPVARRPEANAGRDGLEAQEAFERADQPRREAFAAAKAAARAAMLSVYAQLQAGTLRAIGRPETGANPLRWIMPNEWEAYKGVPGDKSALELVRTVYRQIRVMPVPPSIAEEREISRGLVPPPGGWDLMEAAEAIFPGNAKRCWEAEIPAELFKYLNRDLLKAVIARSDLQFEGTHRGPPLDRGRVKISRDHYLGGDFIDLDIMEGKFWIGASRSQQVELIAVRIVRVGEPSAGDDGAAIAPPVGQAAPVADASRVVSDERGKPAKPDRAGVAPPVTKSKRGRQPSPMKANAQEFAMRWLEENGAPQRGDGSQAVLERDILALAGRRGEHELGASTVRNWVREWIDEFSADRASGQKFE